MEKMKNRDTVTLLLGVMLIFIAGWQLAAAEANNFLLASMFFLMGFHNIFSSAEVEFYLKIERVVQSVTVIIAIFLLIKTFFKL